MTDSITPTDQSTSRPTLTVEMALWVLVAVVALALRLPHLDAAPLNPAEARETTLAWRAVTGRGMPEGTNYSPLLFAANALLFTLCGTSDVLARLWPALFGGVLALTPFLLRQRIGRLGALASGLYLALSPTALVASRQLDGTVVAAAGGMLLLGGLVQSFDTDDVGQDNDRRLWLALSVAGLALAVTSSPVAYGLLLTLGLACLILAWAWFDKEHASRLMPHASRLTLPFILTVLALSTGLGWNLAGIGATGDLFATWLSRFGLASNPTAFPLTLMAVYEPLALLLGLGGLLWAIRRGHRFGILLGLWAGLGILLLALMPGRAPLDVLWVVLPLAMLAGVAAKVLLHSLGKSGGWLNEGLYAFVVLLLWAHFYLMLARYATLGAPADLALALLSLLLQVLLGTSFALTIDIGAALHGAATGTCVALLAVTLSTGWGIAHVRPSDPRELLVDQPTADGVRDLVETLRDLSWRETGMPATLPFTFEAASDSTLAWYLRDFSAARRVENVGDLGIESSDGRNSSVLVTSERELALSNVEYVGQDFPLRRSGNQHEIHCTWEWPPRCDAVVAWLLFRKTPSPPATEQWVTLWLHHLATDD
jgi:uncharacterized protein (TIGR03663 family)